LVSTLLEAHKFDIDLRDEIAILIKDCGDDQEESSTKGMTEINGNVLKSGDCFYLKHKKGEHTLTNLSALASDGENMFLHHNGLGLLKISEGRSNPGAVKNHNADLRSGEDVNMVFLNGKILLRSSEAKPFVYIDPETLEEKKDEELELEKEGPNLQWEANEDTGRSLTFTPLITDGQYLYVIAK
jgi:hypothetical protein